MYNYKEHEKSITIGKAQFTYLSEGIIRLEYSKTHSFNQEHSIRMDISTDTRSFDEVFLADKTHILRFGNYHLKYKNDHLEFNQENLGVYQDEQLIWSPDFVDDDNLGGVHLGMDCVQKSMIPKGVHPASMSYHDNSSDYHLWKYIYGNDSEVDPDAHYDDKKLTIEQLLAVKSFDQFSPYVKKLFTERSKYPPGLLSKKGYFLYNDSNMPRYDDVKWPLDHVSDNLDLYLILYEDDYQTALKQYQKLFGSTPIIPRYALGLWFSRYPTYNQNQLESLINTFEEKKLPLDVLVLDLEWHKRGWYGFDWDYNHFPNPKEFIESLKCRNIYTTLNVHPDGVPMLDAGFETFKQKTSLENTSKEDIYHLDFTNKRQVKAFMEIFHQPQDDLDIDFWWIDGSAENTITNCCNQFFTNEIYMRHAVKQNKGRPFIFSRSAGLGSHRYPVHFTGDTYSQFEVLESQVEYTMRAGHIGLSFVTHDIGGHMWNHKHVNPELLCRWYQFGAMSPIFRLHSSAGSERLPWMYDEIVEDSMEKAMHFRITLLPYLYNLVVESHRTGMPMVRSNPLMLPLWEEGYQIWDNFFLGDRIYCTPIVTPGDFKLLTLPPGQWFSAFRKERINSDGHTSIFLLNQSDSIPPHFIKADSLLIKQDYKTRASELPKRLILEIYMSGDEINDEYVLIEDDGYNNQLEDQIKTTFTLKGSKILNLNIRKENQGSFDIVGRCYSIILKSDLPFKIGGVNCEEEEYYSLRFDDINTTSHYDVTWL